MIFVKDKIEVVKINKSGLKKEMKLDLFLTVFIHLLLLNIGTLRSSARRKLDDAAFKILKSNVNLKCPISWLGILHISNIWNPMIRIAIYLVVRKFYLCVLFRLLKLMEVTSNYVYNAVIDIVKIYHLILNRIGTI